MGNIIEYFQSKKERVLLLGYFLIVIFLAAPLSEIFGQAWEQGNVANAIIHARVYAGASLEEVTVVLFGLFVGLLTLMTIDPKKRWQGFLLWAGLGISLIGLQSMGLFLPNISFVDSIVWLIGGMAIGFILGGGRKITRVQTAEPLEFRRASVGIFYILALIVVISLLELHIQYPDLFDMTSDGIQVASSVAFDEVGIEESGLISNLLVSGIFVVVLQKFIQYEAQTDFFVLGPRGSGKSLFLIGAYMNALERSDDNATTPMNPSDDLVRMVEKLDMQNTDWIVESTAPDETKLLKFRYVHGAIFPKNITITALDYAGEYLQRIPDALTGLLENEEDQVLLSLAQSVQEADTLLLLVDIERFDDGSSSLDVDPYYSILQATDNKDVLVVATKSDVLADRFQSERGLEAHRHYEEFKQYVNDELQSSQNIQMLSKETGGAELHPVYYQTKVTDDGERVPMRDANGNVMTVGFGPLLDKLGT